TLGYLLHALLRGRPAGANPWNSRSFEWRTSSPPPEKNFDGEPELQLDAYDYTTRWDPADGGR
ncbi:MAG TPA: hypothetical protein VIK01_24535, partial [Polyangiaceae bacterium]